MKALLTKNRRDLALLVGNGINLYGASPDKNSWANLLSTLARTHLGKANSKVPRGISMTEFYDVLELAHARTPNELGLQRQFCDLMDAWKPLDQHHHVTAWAVKHGVPLLTTNFDNTLGKAAACSLRRIRKTAFTDFYPWDSYYGLEESIDPCTQFGIWHVNGMQHYTRSIRLGLSHYMGSVERARGWLHKGSSRLFASADLDAWSGKLTWLQILFKKPILIFGLSLAENEVFLRWLLIERARYFKKFPDRRVPGWFISPSHEKDPGKFLFLDAVGIKPVAVANYDEIYSEKTWS